MKERPDVATKVVQSLIDDIDGSAAADTVHFSIDSSVFEIDLSEQHATNLRKALEEYTKYARKIKARASNALVEPQVVRSWAQTQGVKVSSRGRVAGQVVAQYKAAH